MAYKIIQQLLSIQGLKIECPQCTEVFPIRQGKLFGMYDKYPPAVQAMIHERIASANEQKAELKEQLAENKKKKPIKITSAALASNFGQISEQILPAFLTFPYQRRECRILFKPIDYIVFTNLVKNGRVDAIKFVDVKTGDARLDRRQKEIRDRVNEGKIKQKIIN